ncbi:2-keto-4-pentenoate hydratase [Sphingoaurantiacus capsulatus]|uniref:2-keto-4-pentenoate hydratase n=1 Tax=Sphingoaurantiacus capsulatus TaxID=1771310 RepID=A0ABV7XGV0_9SPHN
MSSERDRDAIAGRFRAARRAAGSFADFPGELPATLDEAYAVQDAAITGWDRPVLGWKVGRIMPPFEEALGAERLAGPIFDVREGEPAMPVFADGFAAGEAEFLLRLGAVPAGKTRFTLDAAADAIDAVHLGIEIASSPLRPINDIGPAAVVSDFGNNNGLVVGPAIENWRISGFEDWTVTTLIDGVAVGTGAARGFPDGAIGAVRFFLELMARRGIAIVPGWWISSGAVTGVHEAKPGQTVEARFDGHGSVKCRLEAAQPS